MDLGPHAVFIWLCYAAVAGVIAALILALWIDGNRRKRDLADLEQRGLGRSGSEPSPASRG